MTARLGAETVVLVAVLTLAASLVLAVLVDISSALVTDQPFRAFFT